MRATDEKKSSTGGSIIVHMRMLKMSFDEKIGYRYVHQPLMENVILIHAHEDHPRM